MARYPASGIDEDSDNRPGPWEKMESRVREDREDDDRGPTISYRMEQQGKLLDELDSMIGVLIDRLGPVLLENPGIKSNGSEANQDTPGGYSKHQDLIRHHNERLMAHLSVIDTLIHRLDL